MLIVCNCCIYYCWNCLQDNVTRYEISSYCLSQQESGTSWAPSVHTGGPPPLVIRDHLTWVPTGILNSPVSGKWENVVTKQNLSCSYNRWIFETVDDCRGVHGACNDDEGNLNWFKWVWEVAVLVRQIKKS